MMKTSILFTLLAAALHNLPHAHAFSLVPSAIHRAQLSKSKVPFSHRATKDSITKEPITKESIVPEGKASAIATGTIDAPIDKVWELFASFPDMKEWWPIYDNWVDTGDDIGSTRTFSFKNSPAVTTSEILVFRDDEAHTLRYDLVKLEGIPIAIDGIQTVVSFTPNGDSTDVNWRSWTQSPAAAVLTGRQTNGYLDGIAHLQKRFNPSLGKLDVTVVSGKDLNGGSGILIPYASIVVDGSEPVTVMSQEWGANPEFDADTVTFNIMKKESKAFIALFDSNLGADSPLGYAVVDIQKDLESGKPLTKELELHGTGSSTITLNLEMHLANEGDTLPRSKSQDAIDSLLNMKNTLDLITKRAVDIQRFASAPEPPVWEYGRKAGLPKNVKGLPASEVLPPHKIALMVQSISEYMYTQFKLPQRLPAVMGTYEQYGAFFAPEGEEFVPKPIILDNNLWSEDDEFLRQIFSGLNPLQVKVVFSKDGLPANLLAQKAKDGSDVDKLIKEKRLYVLDYPELRDLDLHLNDVTLYAPTMLIYRTGAEKLDVLGIQLEPTREDAPVYTPDSKFPKKYLFSKLHVACSDNQVHQFIGHLGLCHLAVEPMAVASHNVLEKNDHPLGWFLKPHFRDNIGINYLARQTLVADEGAITDKTFATGTKQGVMMVATAFESYDFLTSGLPDELKKRGFDRADDFKGFRYRDDGWLIWDSLWTYSEDMVNALYKSDADVAADKVVQEWCVEASDADKADIHGFPEAIKEKALLVKVLTTTIWTASALHSALNYAQYPYTSTPINRAAKITAGVPDGNMDITDEYIMKAIPAGVQAGFQGLMSWLLATPEHPTLDELSDRIPNKNNPLPLVEFRSKYPEVFINFDKNLAEVEDIIEKRNEGLKVPYDVLLPSHVAASINI